MSEENLLFPGRPSYKGPTQGWFGLLHHDVLTEESHDVMERVNYVKREKPQREIAIRLYNMIYLGEDYDAKLAPIRADRRAKLAPIREDYRAKRAPIDADYHAKRAAIDADYDAKRAAIDADYLAKRAAIDADYHAKRAPIDADYDAKLAPIHAEIETYIKAHIHDCAWRGGELRFASEENHA